MNKYEIIKTIGDGTFGVVYEGRNKLTKEKVAIKKLKQKYKTFEECKNKIEIKILESLNHENIVKLKEVIREYNGEVSYIFEFCDCNLFQFINTHREKNKIIPEPIIRDIILQITRGLNYLHMKQYLHRDLKPENILLILNNYNYNDNNINNTNIKVKIADFGTAKKIPSKDDLTITEYVCTRWYRAPECVLRADYYNETSDIWAIGCIMAELYKLGPIFPGENEFDQINQIFKILGTPTKTRWPWGYSQAEYFGIKFSTYYKKDLKSILGYICNDGINLLNDIFQFEASQRPLCSKILNHPYFKATPKPYINNISIRLRSSIPVMKKDNSNTKRDYIANISIENKRSDRYMNDRDNKIKLRINSLDKKISDNIIKGALTEKASKIDINKNKRGKNSFSNNRKNANNIYESSNQVKIINSRKIDANNKFKYMKMDESKYGLILKHNEENKENLRVNHKKNSSNFFSIKTGRNNIINYYSKNNSFINDSFEENKTYGNKSFRILNNRNNNNYMTFNKNDNQTEKNINKNKNKKLRNLNMINNINNYSSYINKDTQKNNISRSNTSFIINNKIINMSNRRNKHRRNYKYYEVKESIKNKYNGHIYPIKNNIKNDHNEKKCICSIGLYLDEKNKNILNHHHNIIDINLKNERPIHAQKNLSYKKSINTIKDKKIQLSPVKKNNYNLFGRPTLINKTLDEKAIYSKDISYRRTRGRLINLVINDDNNKFNSVNKKERRKYIPFSTYKTNK